jgi:hypothetical protein
MNIKAEIVGDNLILTIPMQTPTPSASGKTLIVASSHGNVVTTVVVNGRPVVVGVNAYIRRVQP